MYDERLPVTMSEAGGPSFRIEKLDWLTKSRIPSATRPTILKVQRCVLPTVALVPLLVDANGEGLETCCDRTVAFSSLAEVLRRLIIRTDNDCANTHTKIVEGKCVR